jgi:hypothetical protein
MFVFCSNTCMFTFLFEGLLRKSDHVPLLCLTDNPSSLSAVSV